MVGHRLIQNNNGPLIAGIGMPIFAATSEWVRNQTNGEKSDLPNFSSCYWGCKILVNEDLLLLPIFYDNYYD